MKITIEFDSLEEAAKHIHFPPNAEYDLDVNNAPRIEPVNFVTPPPAIVEPEKPKRQRKKAAEQQPAPPVVEEPQTPAVLEEFEDAPAKQDFLDDDEPTAPAVKLTKDDVRAALVNYQERLSTRGVEVTKARETVLDLLEKIVGPGKRKLGECPEDKFAAVVAAANNAK